MTLQSHLARLLAVKGVSAAALVSTSGELIAGEADDPAMIDRLVGLQTSALAAGQALGELIPPLQKSLAELEAEGDAVTTDAPSAPERGQLMAIYQDGPVLFAPLPDGESVCVVALVSPQDVGRARFALRSLLPALATAERPVA